MLQSTWVFKRKRFPDDTFKKYKVCFCVRGDQQIEGLDVFDTYAPVISWITVRLLFVIFLAFGLATHQVDYTNAFFRAQLDQKFFVELPNSFEGPNKVILLNNLVYGLRQSLLNFYNHLRQGLESRDFIKSDHDDFLLTNGTIIILSWVDDAIFYSKSNISIQNLILNLKNELLLEKKRI